MPRSTLSLYSVSKAYYRVKLVTTAPQPLTQDYVKQIIEDCTIMCKAAGITGDINHAFRALAEVCPEAVALLANMTRD
jgi:hypothetical protein